MKRIFRLFCISKATDGSKVHRHQRKHSTWNGAIERISYGAGKKWFRLSAISSPIRRDEPVRRFFITTSILHTADSEPNEQKDDSLRIAVDIYIVRTHTRRIEVYIFYSILFEPVVAVELVPSNSTYAGKCEKCCTAAEERWGKKWK